MNPIVYLIQANLFLLLFYGFYVLFLRKETFNNLNRGYLVIAAITAFTVPFLQSDLVRSWFVTKQVNEVIYTAYSPEMVVFSTASEAPVLWMDVLQFIYLGVAAVLCIRLIANILMTTRLFSNFSETVGGAFSFFGKIVVDENLEGRDTIYRHEEIHSKHLHSADVILFELIAIVCWFNPVVYFYRNAVRNIHEFIADELASETVADKGVYATLLFSQQFKISPSVLTNSFYKPATLKLRVEMLLKNRSKKTALMKYGLIAPLFLLMIVLASATVIDKEGLEEIAESVEVPLTELPSMDRISVLSIDKVNQTIREIEGYVKNSNGTPLAGAVITKKGSSEGTMTDKNGYFKLNVSEQNTRLIISFVGFETREIGIDGITEVTVRLIKQENVLDEMVVVSTRDSQVKGEEIFTIVEGQPEFPGGVSEMYKYIGERIRYPAKAQRANVEGKVFVKFVVQKDGEIGSIDILKGIGFGCDEEAIRVIAQMPKWTPGKQNGRAVSVYFTMPISFRLGDEVAKERFPKGASGLPVDFINPKTEVSSTATKIIINGSVGEGKPIFVVDGVLSPEGTLQDLDPANIKEISVLKGANATDLYGQKGKDGVILISTKKGDGLGSFMKGGAGSKSYGTGTNITSGYDYGWKRPSNTKITAADGQDDGWPENSTVQKIRISSMKDALFIVDGVEMTSKKFKKKYEGKSVGNNAFIYEPNEAVKKFGEKGKNGVIVIRTQK
jgi:TonB family protein